MTEATSKSLPRTLGELRSCMHGYRIRATGNDARISIASIIASCLDTLNETTDPAHARAITRNMRIAARDMAAKDPAMA
ncbi:hypothetical protein ABIB82_003917 [Bradyrhizobium sp. i1.8.4]|uniref:hypothetical protein n=1 Tax=unclassified Bradyrhizobium TaxID=2631580 RepID=UPI003D1E193E